MNVYAGFGSGHSCTKLQPVILNGGSSQCTTHCPAPNYNYVSTSCSPFCGDGYCRFPNCIDSCGGVQCTSAPNNLYHLYQGNDGYFSGVYFTNIQVYFDYS